MTPLPYNHLCRKGTRNCSFFYTFFLKVHKVFTFLRYYYKCRQDKIIYKYRSPPSSPRTTYTLKEVFPNAFLLFYNIVQKNSCLDNKNLIECKRAISVSSKRRHFYFDINYKENTKMAKYIFVTGGLYQG